MAWSDCTRKRNGATFALKILSWGPFKNSINAADGSAACSGFFGMIIEWIRSPIFKPCLAADDPFITEATIGWTVTPPAGRNPNPVVRWRLNVIRLSWLGGTPGDPEVSTWSSVGGLTCASSATKCRFESWLEALPFRHHWWVKKSSSPSLWE